MPQLTIEARRRIISLHSVGYSVSTVFRRLEQENVQISKRAIYKLVEKFCHKGVVRDLPKRKKAKILGKEMEAFIEEKLKRNDKLMSTAINASLVRKWPNLRVSYFHYKARTSRNWLGLHQSTLLPAVTCGICCFNDHFIYYYKCYASCNVCKHSFFFCG